MRRSQRRIIRDPIYGDISVGPIQIAVIDTTPFQRLRYIRQNGLLHFVFPGAVHTRFAHSMGAMAVAHRAFARMFPAVEDAHRELEYLGTVFELAALLHDVGHCAFSHAIEKVDLDGSPFFHSLPRLVEFWGDESTGSFVEAYRQVHPDLDLDSDPVMHEQLGLLFTGRIFQNERVSTACEEILNADASTVLQDVRAILDDHLGTSDRFRAAASEARTLIHRSEEAEPGRFPQDLQQILHDLVSGTLDVDRLDYLVRDSFFTGVP